MVGWANPSLNPISGLLPDYTVPQRSQEIPSFPLIQIDFQGRPLAYGDTSKSCSGRDLEHGGVLSTCTTLITIRTHYFGEIGLRQSSKHPRMSVLASVGAESPQLSCKPDIKAPARQTAEKTGSQRE